MSRPPRVRPSAAAALCLATCCVLTLPSGGCATRERPPVLPPETAPATPPTPPRQVRPAEPIGEEPPRGPVTPSGVETPAAPDAAGASSAELEPPPEGYFTIAGVLGEVNGRAVYAADVIGPRRNQLRSLALQYPPLAFEREAAMILARDLRERLSDVALLSVFERAATPRERQMATLVTTNWRQQFISRHGGSEAEARRVAREQFGLTLEALGEDEYRRHLSQVFARRHILPRVRPAAAEVRAEYHRQRQAGALDDPGGIDFSVIEIRPASADAIALQAARGRAADVQARAAAGEPFDLLAAEFNDNPSLAARGGRLPDTLLPLAPGAFAVAEVDRAAWQLGDGGVSDVISVSDNSDLRLFVIRVNEKRSTRTRTFDEVQRALVDQMTSAQQQRLFNEYVTTELARVDAGDERQRLAMLRTALEIVMQDYARWRDEGDAAAMR